MYNILIVEDDQFSMENMVLSLSSEYNIYTSANVKDAHKVLSENPVDIVLLDIKLPGENGLKLIEKSQKDFPQLKFIVITGYSDEKSIISALKLGAHDLLKKPYDEEEMHNSIGKLVKSIELEKENQTLKDKLQRENKILKKELDKNLEVKEEIIIGSSSSLLKVMDNAKKVARHNINALICGESGTGKELLARYIHRNGNRSQKPFITINCASLTPSLFESELFGYEKGSFTNAMKTRIGLFEVADGGILFLDEITEIDIGLQAKLLRVVEEKKVQRIGSNQMIDIDVQVLSSTNRDPNEAVNSGRLREDLYHRLANTVLELPPLRNRKDDIVNLLSYFKQKYDSIYDVNSREFDESTLALIVDSEWKGNIRHLSNFVKNWSLFGEDASLEEVKTWINSEINNRIHSEDNFRFEQGTMTELDEAKKWLIQRALNLYSGNKSRAAEHLGVSYAGFLKMLKNM